MSLRLLQGTLFSIRDHGRRSHRVDPEQVAGPHRWDVCQIRNFMIVFGLASVAFDYLTFGTLRWGFDASAVDFRSGWFLESMATELAVMLVLRTRRPFVRSRPSCALAASSVVVALVTLVLPYSPLAESLGLDGPSAGVIAALAAITAGYVLASEAIKHRFPRLLE